jgi:ATP-binding cassette subfamily B protein
MRVPLKRYLRLLSKYLKPQLRGVVFLSVLLAFNIVLQLINPQIVSYFIDSVKGGKSSKVLITAAIIFIIAAVIQQFLKIAATYMAQNIGWTSTNALRIDLIEHCLNLDMKFHKSHQPGEILERVDGDVSALFSFFSKMILNLLSNLVLMIGVLALLFIKDWRIGLSMTAFVAAAVIILLNIQKIAVPKWVEERKINASFYGFLGENISSTEDVKSLGAVNYVMNKFYKILRKWLPARREATMMGYRMWMITLLIFALGNAVAFAIGGYLWSKGIITIGTVYLVFNYTGMLERPLEQIRTQLEDLQRAGASITRIEEMFAENAEITEKSGLSIPDGAISIKVDELHFEYEKDNNVLNNISYELKSGRTLGIIGRTGSGKTTLARLLVRLYDAVSGAIEFDNINIKDISGTELRNKIAYVTQDVQLFKATVRDNLTFFNSDIKDEFIIKILDEMGLMEWYNRLPEGLDTVLDNGGGGLSSGEAQLLALVRAFMKDPGLIILDEASSRLDPVTEMLIDKALDKLLQGRTCIIIAHHLKTLDRADEILILDKGTIIESGKREELLSNLESTYNKLLVTGVEEVLV